MPFVPAVADRSDGRAAMAVTLRTLGLVERRRPDRAQQASREAVA
jgi:hypothetical protein